MFRLWGKLIKDSRLIQDKVVCIDDEDSRTHKVFRAIEEICYDFDLEKPIWLESNIQAFKHHSKTRFTEDNFIEDISFDYLEIYVIEE